MLQQIGKPSSTLAEKIKPPKRPKGRPKGTVSLKIPTKSNLSGRPKKDSDKLAIKSTVVLDLNRNTAEQTVINRGGRGSSKSHSIAQSMIEYFFTIPNVKILIARKTQPSLRLSVMPLVKGIIDSYGLWNKVFEQKVDKFMWSPVKGLIHFAGLDDPEKVKSSDWNMIWLEEATEFEYNDYMNLLMNLRAPITYGWQRNRLFMSFNPIDEYHWIKTNLIDKKTEDVKEIPSTYLYNPFLTDDYRRTIESLQFQDPNYYRIFAKGEWGKLDHLIFKNWISVPYLIEGEGVFGLDFGYNNPTSLIKCNIDSYEVGVEQRLYETGLTNSALIKRMHQILTEDEILQCPIYADGAEPQRIQELIDAGFWVKSADKNVKDGIDYVKRCKLRVKDDSDNVIKELRGYSYRVDRNGRVLEEPIKFNDHCMDSIRYAIYSHSLSWGNTVNIRVL